MYASTWYTLCVFDKSGKPSYTKKHNFSINSYKSWIKGILPSIAETSLRMSFDQMIEGMIEARVNDLLNLLIKMIDRLGPPLVWKEISI